MPQATAAPEASQHARFLATRTFGSLDGLRAISIVAVLWHHTAREPGALAIAGRGFLGVDLFFVISGFLIVTLLLREERRTGTISLRSFYARRFLRIFPPYYLMLLVVAVAVFLKRGNTLEPVVHDLPYALLYVSNLVHMRSFLDITWSLATEEQFYLAVPALLRRARRAAPVVLPVACVLAYLPTFGIFPGLELPAFFRQTTFGPILVGVLLAFVMNDARGHRVVARLLAHPWSSVAALGLVALAASHPAEDLSGLPRILIHLSMATLVAACVVRERHALVPILTLWPMRRIGIVSYGIYLYHMLTWYFVHLGTRLAGVESQLLFFAANTLASWLVAELSFRWFESPVLALKARFAGGTAARSAPARADAALHPSE
jgi:peptidoglycan/LPS O-acetylase OafA/YrhL